MENLQPLFPDLQAHRPMVIAGPCSVETEYQVLSTARQLSAEGIKIFRGGVWKPRTSPGSFEGVGEKGLEWLGKVKEETGMKVAIEVATRSHVEKAIEKGVDIIWLGARTTTNPFAVQEIADALKESGKDVVVLVKNPVNPDLELWIGALQRIYNAGIRRLGAIHRGFSAYGNHIYRNQPQWAIPIELQHRFPALPIFCDPSHITGKRELIRSVAQQALDLNFFGLIIESHYAPDTALSDRSQQLSPTQLGELLKGLVVRDKKVTTDDLSSLRAQIDCINEELLVLLARRMKVSCEIGQYKKEHEMTVIQPDRYNDLMERLVKNGEELGLSPDFVKRLLRVIHEESVRQQLGIVNKD